ncbi:glyoxalase [Nonomuraea spiralis]|nr:glyoxalase [Nonomuraea spiralis]
MSHIPSEAKDQDMQLFVNLPIKDLDRSQKFFTELGFTMFGMAEGMASVIISEQTQVMLLTEPTFATYVSKEISDATTSTEAILVLGMENPAQVDELVDKALALGATPAGTPQEGGFRYQRGFADLDGHHWEALCLVQPA